MIRDNRIQLSDHFTYNKLFRFVIAPICTMLFTSIYGIVDGFFVSKYYDDCIRRIYVWIGWEYTGIVTTRT